VCQIRPMLGWIIQVFFWGGGVGVICLGLVYIRHSLCLKSEPGFRICL